MRYLASVVAVGLLGVMAMTSAGCFLEPDPPPKPVSNWTIEEAREFGEFPLYWLDERYEGLPLTVVTHGTDGDGVRHATFFYGETSLTGDPYSASWLPPLELDIQPYCGFSPEEFLGWEEEVSEYSEAEVSGVQMRSVSGYLKRYSSREASLVLWTGGSAIYLSTWKTELDIEQAARNLIPIAEGIGATLNPLPPPITTSC